MIWSAFPSARLGWSGRSRLNRNPCVAGSSPAAAIGGLAGDRADVAVRSRPYLLMKYVWPMLLP
jgi:hypothetical protein